MMMMMMMMMPQTQRDAENGSSGPLYFAPSADTLYYKSEPYEILKLGPANAVHGATKKGSELKYRG